MARDQRRLAAIVSADVVGYSLLMGSDESATLAALKAHRRELIDPKIAEYGGRIVKTTGDGLLLEFPSVVDAVRCAVDVQRGMGERNRSVPAERQIQFRVGINVGDIIIDDGDIFGDGVNVAARLETLADPGGICVSRVVRDQVLDKLSFAFEDLGPKGVKNIARPVEVFRIDLDRVGMPPRLALHPRWRRLWPLRPRHWLVIGAVPLVVAGLALPAFHRFWEIRSSASAPPMSVAVMPLAGAKGPTDIQYADDFRNDLVTRIAVYASGIAKVQRVDDPGAESIPRAVGRRYNVRYVIEGSLQSDAARRSVQLRLIDAERGAQVWGGRYVFEEGASAAESASRNRKIFTGVAGAMYDAEVRRVGNEPPNRLDAVELVLRGEHMLGQAGPASLTEAKSYYDAALRKDPNLVAALIGKSSVLDTELDTDPDRDRKLIAREMDELTEKALLLDSTRASVWTSRSVALAAGGRWSAASEAIDNAIQREPSNPHLYVYKAQWMVFTGRPAEAVQLVEHAMAQDPDYVGWAMMVACQAHLFLGQPGQAIAECERAAPFEPNRMLQLFLAAAYGNQGELQKAAAARQLAIQKMKVRTIAQLRAMRYSDDQDYLKLAEEYLYPGLAKAGMPLR